MTKTTSIVIISLLLAVIIAIVPLVIIQNSEFGGADGQAEELIGEISPNYEPWAENAIAPPGGETESLLFCLQVGLGAGVFCFGLGYLVARKKYSKKIESEE